MIHSGETTHFSPERPDETAVKRDTSDTMAWFEADAFHPLDMAEAADPRESGASRIAAWLAWTLCAAGGVAFWLFVASLVW
ncbi:hypothetical protein KKP04_02955 [Rhodomicrobium sp. Az07]|uniref:hypothetical protein n=1 Tax=Rhodomicrobium sp. Az07 TaxID=2839034 RepID=UPI001BE6260B|nr:hypothetical protein [Rhodomicrobium sp. Az07]MBT3069826.1 hypothetical protein [Rhodomicrobium sp. Az07]